MLPQRHALSKSRGRPEVPKGRSPFGQTCWAYILVPGTGGEPAMIRFIIDAVLFSCMGASITGIVVAAATFIS
jgi:hypothetical protein